ncbi:MAG: response regulator [Gluconacetobacter diazotrophicus]|nr:response regulator [Gluconacetobacter diazotrophicus]
MAADFLRHNGFRVLEAENGAAAARLIESGVAIDVLVTDQSMPGGMTGLQLVQLCRQRRPTLPSLLTSGFVDLPAEPDVRVLRKPYKLSRLLEMIREHLPPDEPT